MDLYTLDAKSLHDVALRAANNVNGSHSHMLRVADAVEFQKLYLECELPNLYQYCVRLLHLPTGVAKEIISVVNKSKEVPALLKAVIEDEVTLSKAKKICSVVTPDNFEEWIDLARHETSRVIERCVAVANPKEAIKESLTYASADRLEFRLGVSEEWSETLTKVKDLLSQKKSCAVSSEDALLHVMQEFIEKHDPVKKAERAMKRRFSGTNPNAKPLKKSNRLKRQPIKRLTIHKVHFRDKNQCTHVSAKYGRCEEKRWLDIHHIVPVSEGGVDTPENLTILCHAHHKMRHHNTVSWSSSSRHDRKIANE